LEKKTSLLKEGDKFFSKPIYSTAISFLFSVRTTAASYRHHRTNS